MPGFVMELCMIAQCCGVGILRMVADDIINILFGNVVQDETRSKHVLIIKPNLISECTRAFIQI
jgi:hypothetical protein